MSVNPAKLLQVPPVELFLLMSGVGGGYPMICETTERPKRQPHRGHPRPVPVHAEPTPKVITVFRRSDNTVCHARCRRPLSLQGIRGLLEADFYCLGCLIHVTLPLAVLDSVPLGGEDREEIGTAL